jgi:hypothetical protein
VQIELTRARLEGAVAAGILSAEQAERIVAHLAASGAPTYAPTEEGVEIARGFHDIFITIGTVLILVAAWSVGHALVALPVSWLLAEALHRRKDTRLPMIVLSASFVAAALLSFGAVLNDLDPIHTSMRSIEALKLFGTAALAGLVFLLRFRTPFAAWPVAASLTATIVFAAADTLPGGFSNSRLTYVLLACGLVTFAAAMALDLKDRQRETWLSGAAFWLHLAAAPQIVHALMWNSFFSIRAEGLNAALVALALVLAVTIVALIIDRRSLIVSALVYFTGAVTYLVYTSGASNVVPLTLLVVGGSVLLVGFAWRPLRGGLLALLPASLAQRLSPL